MEPTASSWPPTNASVPDAAAVAAHAMATTWLDTTAQLNGSLWWMTDREGLIAGERRLSAYTGLPAAALTGAGWLAAVAPADRAAIRKRWQTALRSGALLETACRFLRADGQTRWLTVRSLPAPAATGVAPLRLWIATQTAQERAVRNISYYRALFDQTSQGVMLIGAQGQPLRVNKAALQMLGLSLAQARGESEAPPGWGVRREDGSAFETPFLDLANATAGGQAVHIFWQVTADDWPHSRWLSVTGSPVIRAHAQSRPRTMVFLTEVTDHVRRREAMQSLAERSTDDLASLRAALDRMTDSFIVLDYEGRFTYMNARAREQFTGGNEPLLGKRFWEAFPILAGTDLEAEYHRILREQTPSAIETPVGENTWYEVRSYPAADGISVYIRDITSQKRTMAELDAALAREREARADAEMRAQQFDAVFEAVSDAMLVFDAHGATQRANRAVRDLMAMFGQSLSLPMPGSPFESLEPASGAGATDAPIELPLRRILAGETLTGERTVDLALRAPDGRDIYLNISGAPIRSSDGAIQGAVESLRDVTAQREAERERSRTMSLVAHELRMPLTAIKLSIDLSLRRASRGFPIEPATLDVAASSCLQLERMVSDLVDAARAERENMVMEFERCDVAELAAQAVTEQQAITDKPILFEAPPTPLTVSADRARIHQVLTNLISNAIKYSPPATPVELLVEARDSMAWVGVSDEGPGVRQEAMPHLFEAFYRAPDVASQTGQSGGLGLGLFLCKRIVDLHGGQIGMQNRPEHGSLFWFSLPLELPTENL